MPYIETELRLNEKTGEQTSDGWVNHENLFFRLERTINKGKLLSVEKWRDFYRKACRANRLDPEESLDRYQALHNQIATEVANGDEEVNLEFLRRELQGLRLEDKATSWFRLYRLGVVCSRKPEHGQEQIMEDWSRALFQAAFKRRQDPQVARGAIIEIGEKARKRKKERARLIKQERRGKTPKPPQLFHTANNSEVFGALTAREYRKRLIYWQDILAGLTTNVEIDWLLFRKEYERLVETAKKLRDTRVYDKTRFFEKQDYEEMVKNNDPEAILKGLSALHTSREPEKCETPGFRLLTDVAFKLPPPASMYRPPKPWPAFVAFAVKEELITKLGEVTTKPTARRRDLNDIILRAKTKGLTPIEGIEKDLYERPKENGPLDQIPH